MTPSHFLFLFLFSYFLNHIKLSFFVWSPYRIKNANKYAADGTVIPLKGISIS
jgi:hypothetical protein